MNDHLESKVHHGFVDATLRQGRTPSAAEVAAALDLPLEKVRETLRSLERGHGVVLHPHVCEPWILHPFSASPSATWVEGEGRGWWAPCLWCACGIAALAGGKVTIHSRIGGEAEDVDIHVENGRIREGELCVHFALPPRAAWGNVHHFCATVLPFHRPEQVDAWCQRHGIAKGAVVPIQQVCDLGREWYGHHADVDWQKWSVQEAAAIFAKVGLTNEFWQLPQADGRF